MFVLILGILKLGTMRVNVSETFRDVMGVRSTGMLMLSAIVVSVPSSSSSPSLGPLIWILTHAKCGLNGGRFGDDFVVVTCR